MPNHFTVVALCGRDWSRLDDGQEIDTTPLVGANLCEIIAPLPEGLRGIVASTPPCRYRHKLTGEFYKDANGPTGDDRGDYERIPLSDSEIAKLKDNYGAATWYEWQVDNWGTKWGTYGLKVYKLGGDGAPLLVEFQTAWGPPSPEMMRRINDYLCETYCLKNIKWLGYDPGNNSTVDIELSAAVTA